MKPLLILLLAISLASCCAPSPSVRATGIPNADYDAGYFQGFSDTVELAPYIVPRRP